MCYRELQWKRKSDGKGFVKKLFGFGKARVGETAAAKEEKRVEDSTIQVEEHERRRHLESRESSLSKRQQQRYLAHNTSAQQRLTEDDVASRKSRYRPQRTPKHVPDQNNSPLGPPDRKTTGSLNLSPARTRSLYRASSSAQAVQLPQIVEEPQEGELLTPIFFRESFNHLSLIPPSQN
jgi:hypothetical protein